MMNTTHTSAATEATWQQRYNAAATESDKEGVLCALLAARIRAFAQQETDADHVLVSGLGERRIAVMKQLAGLSVTERDDTSLHITLDGPQNAAKSAELVLSGLTIVLSGKLHKGDVLELPRPRKELDLKQTIIDAGLDPERLPNGPMLAHSQVDSLWEQLRIQMPQSVAELCAQNNAVYKIQESETGITIFTRQLEGSSSCFMRKRLDNEDWLGTESLPRLLGCL